jgi:hypothetical protein
MAFIRQVTGTILKLGVYMSEKRERKGTLFVFGDFDDIVEKELNSIFEFANERNFVKVVLYPHHDLTLRRMGIQVKNPYHSRVKWLEELASLSVNPIPTVIDEWEGKRKKYTPVETSLAFLKSKYPAPYFLYADQGYAVKISSYVTFEDWIREVRLFIKGDGRFIATKNLEKYNNRWEII